MIRLRAHHILCLAQFVGKGYDERFTAYVSALPRALRSERSIIITAAEPDEMCLHCPNMSGGRCLLGECDVAAKDAAALTVLELTAGSACTVDELNSKLGALSLESYELVCGGCRWQNEGVCAYTRIRPI
ncbi:MAG: DUF1284 domain-containing protein [Clostridia bacterium]|nr:DUF1284 domain-containing protein [Clostridia bacterium]